MNIVKVKTSQRVYDIYIKKGLFGKVMEENCSNLLYFLSPYIQNSSKIFFITDNNIFSIYSKKIEFFLKKLARDYRIFLLEEGEKQKNLDNIKLIYDSMLEFNMHRNDALLAFGGGVIGDISGFAASNYHRGLPLLHIPTTIIAQVDSSIGGKTAVNLKNAKNIIGSFYQPCAIFIDNLLLSTLPEKEVINGFGEIIKYGIVFDKSILDTLKKLSDTINPEEENSLLKLVDNEEFFNIICKCCKIKARVVARDEFDVSYRNLLNFGHTFGHAIEKSSNLEGINHGSAVAIGMLMAVDASILSGHKLGNFKEELLKIYSTLKIPQKLKCADVNQLLDSMKYDKKFNSGKTKFVLIKGLNKPEFVYDLDFSILKEAVNRNISGG